MNAVSKSAGTRKLNIVSCCGGEATVDLIICGKTSRYTFTKLAVLERHTEFRSEEFGGGRYTTLVHDDHQTLDSCTCEAGCQGVRCKHVDAIVALAARGKFD